MLKSTSAFERFRSGAESLYASGRLRKALDYIWPVLGLVAVFA